jgi:hypothetical protein
MRLDGVAVIDHPKVEARRVKHSDHRQRKQATPQSRATRMEALTSFQFCAAGALARPFGAARGLSA